MTTNLEDFQYRSHRLRIELDAATSEVMKLMAAKEIRGERWEAATKRRQEAYERWNAHVNGRAVL